MEKKLDGRIVVVTGAGRGIGLAYARGLAESGASVVVADIDGELADAATAQLTSEGHTALAVTVDVSDRSSTLEMAERVRDRFGTAHVLVNNAAIYHSMKRDSQMTVDIDYWRKIFAVNLDGALLCTQVLGPMMIEAGWGRVINQSSAAVYLGNGGHYGCSKAALAALTQGFAKELGPHGITVNAIAPGMVLTEATLIGAPKGRVAYFQEMSAIKGRGQPEDLIGTLQFLASDDAAWITGQTIIVDGGVCKRL